VAGSYRVEDGMRVITVTAMSMLDKIDVTVSSREARQSAVVSTTNLAHLTLEVPDRQTILSPRQTMALVAEALCDEFLALHSAIFPPDLT